MQLNINNDAVVKFTNRLEKMHRSNLPIAIRGALNNAAFDVKQTTMPLSAKSEFVERKKTFFKATSKVKTANGFNVNSMKSLVGFIGGASNQAVADLEEQERGGTIKGRSFIPIDSARVSKNKSKIVRPINQLRKVNFVDARKARGKTQGQKFHKAAHKAGVGGVVLADYKDKTILWKVNSLRRSKNGQWKLTALYSYERGRTVSVKGTNFMKRATLVTARKMNRFFIEQAKRRINK